MEMIQFPAVSLAAGTFTRKKFFIRNSQDFFCSKDTYVVTSVFKKSSRVLTRLDFGVKSTLLQSVIQK